MRICDAKIFFFRTQSIRSPSLTQIDDPGQKKANGKRAMDQYLLLTKKGHIDTCPVSTGPKRGEDAGQCKNKAYTIHPAVAKQQTAQLDRLLNAKANRTEANTVHAFFDFPDSRHEFYSKCQAHVAAHSELLHTDKHAWKAGIFEHLIVYKTINWLDKVCDVDSWDAFYMESTAKLLKDLADWSTIDYLINGEKSRCICLDRLTPEEMEKRLQLKASDKYRVAEAEEPPHDTFGVFSEEEIAERVYLATSYENNRRVLKMLNSQGQVCSSQGHRDIISLLGKWALIEATGAGKSGRLRNLCAMSIIGKSGKSHIIESLLACWMSLACGKHLVHRCTNARFAHEGNSRERMQQY